VCVFEISIFRTSDDGEGNEMDGERRRTVPPHVRAFPARIMIYKRPRGRVTVPDSCTSGSRRFDVRLHFSPVRRPNASPVWRWFSETHTDTGTGETHNPVLFLVFVTVFAPSLIELSDDESATPSFRSREISLPATVICTRKKRTQRTGKNIRTRRYYFTVTFDALNLADLTQSKCRLCRLLSFSAESAKQAVFFDELCSVLRLIFNTDQ